MTYKSKLPFFLLLGALLIGCSPDGPLGFKNQGRQPDLASLQKNAATAPEREYWRLCEKQASCGNDPAKVARFAKDAYAFGLANPQSPFGARAIVVAADARANAYDFPGAIDYFNEAARIFSAHAAWTETAQYAPYVGMRLGDVLNNDGRFAAAFEQWKKTALAWPNSSFMNQLLAQITQVSPKAFRPEEQWKKQLQFFDEALKLAGLNQDARDRLRIERIDVLMRAACEFYVPATQVIGEIDALLNAGNAGKVLDQNRERLEHLREELRTKFPAWTRADYERHVLSPRHGR